MGQKLWSGPFISSRGSFILKWYESHLWNRLSAHGVEADMIPTVSTQQLVYCWATPLTASNSEALVCWYDTSSQDNVHQQSMPPHMASMLAVYFQRLVIILSVTSKPWQLSSECFVLLKFIIKYSLTSRVFITNLLLLSQLTKLDLFIFFQFLFVP